METTLCSLAVNHARGKITAEQVRKSLQRLPPAEKCQEADETWFEGNPENTVTAVQALIGEEITTEQFHAFTQILLAEPASPSCIITRKATT